MDTKVVREQETLSVLEMAPYERRKRYAERVQET